MSNHRRNFDEGTEADSMSCILLQSGYRMQLGHVHVDGPATQSQANQSTAVIYQLRTTNDYIFNDPQKLRVQAVFPEVCPGNVFVALYGAGLVSVLCALAIVLHRGGTPNVGKESNGGKARSAIFDNAKFFLIIMIVMYHYQMLLWDFAENPISPYIRAWSADIGICGFAFITGFFSRGAPSWNKMRTLMIAVLLPFLMYTMAFDIVAFPLLDNYSEHLSVVVKRFANGVPSVSWYLQSVISWKLLAWCLHLVADVSGIPKSLQVMTMTLALFMASAFIPMNIWSLAYGIAYLPCFAAGLLFPIEELMAVIPSSMTLSFAVMGLCSIVAWTTVGWPVQQHWPPRKELHAYLGEESCISYLSWCEAFAGVLQATVIFIALLALACPREEHWFTTIGRDSMYVYLSHFFVLDIYFRVAPKWLSYDPTFMNLASLLVPFAVTLLVSLRPVKCLFCLVVEPYQTIVGLRMKSSSTTLRLDAKGDEDGVKAGGPVLEQSAGSLS